MTKPFTYILELHLLICLCANYDGNVFFFRSFYPCYPPYVTDELRQVLSQFKTSLARMKKELNNMQKDLHKSVPFFSTRYKVGHIK